MATQQPVADVDTTQVTGRRTVHYANVDDIVADAERLASGGYKALGNWSLGKITQHVGRALLQALDGPSMKVAAPMRLMARLLYKKKALREMKPGFKLPPQAAALVPNTEDDAEGIAELRSAVERWKREPQRSRHAFFGKLTPKEWEQLMLRHAEMHMSFLVDN